MRSVHLLVLGLAGCDAAFDLVHVPDPPQGSDWDGDGYFADDNCPAIANPEQHDDDSDGVGTACDPHPGENDVVVVQDLFERDTSTWMTNGTWTKDPGAWTSPPSGGAFTLAAPVMVHRPAIQISFTIDDWDVSSTHANLVAHLDAPNLDGDCAFRRNMDDESLIVVHVGGDDDAEHVAGGFEKSSTYLGTYVRGKDRTWCSVMGTRHDRTDDTEETFSTAPTLIMTRMQVTLHHVTVYQVVP